MRCPQRTQEHTSFESAEDSGHYSNARPSAAGSVAPQIPHLVEQNVLKSPAAISQKSPSSAIDEVSEQNAVSRFNLRPDQTDRMPGVIGNGKRVARIWRE